MPAPDYSKGAAFVRGEYLPIAQASVPITDWGFLRSDATYDVVTVWRGAFFRLDAHLDRFMTSCQRFRLDPGRKREEIVQVLERCLSLSGLRESYVEMIATRGQPPWIPRRRTTTGTTSRWGCSGPWMPAPTRWYSPTRPGT